MEKTRKEKGNEYIGRIGLQALRDCFQIYNDLGNEGKVLVNKKDGLVASVGDNSKLTNAILNLIENPELRKHLAYNAKKITEFWPSKEEYLKNYYDSFLSFRKPQPDERTKTF